MLLESESLLFAFRDRPPWADKIGEADKVGERGTDNEQRDRRALANPPARGSSRPSASTAGCPPGYATGCSGGHVHCVDDCSRGFARPQDSIRRPSVRGTGRTYSDSGHNASRSIRATAWRLVRVGGNPSDGAYDAADRRSNAEGVHRLGILTMMRVIVVGAGAVGTTAVESLHEHQDCAVVDLDPARLKQVSDGFDVRVVRGQVPERSV
jgi:threonine dehydrogenase-like Zn-dependent dehydrogenase